MFAGFSTRSTPGSSRPVPPEVILGCRADRKRVLPVNGAMRQEKGPPIFREPCRLLPTAHLPARLRLNSA